MRNNKVTQRADWPNGADDQSIRWLIGAVAL
jgi:hypothetical protein